MKLQIYQVSSWDVAPFEKFLVQVLVLMCSNYSIVRFQLPEIMRNNIAFYINEFTKLRVNCPQSNIPPPQKQRKLKKRSLE